MKNQPFDQATFEDFVCESGTIQVLAEPRTLRSGRSSHLYVNWRTVTADAYQLQRLAEQVASFVTSTLPKCRSLYGVPEGATKTAVAATMVLARNSTDFGLGSHIVSMGRGRPKEHGAPEDALFIGMPPNGVVVLEDVTTTGGSLRAAVELLLEHNINVSATLTLTDRRPRSEPIVASLPHYAMSTAQKLIDRLREQGKLDENVWRSLMHELQGDENNETSS